MTMKKLSFYLSFILIGMLILQACEKDYFISQQEKVVVITDPVSFSSDIMPIFSSECALPTCHISGAQAPDLSASNAYNELTGLGYVDTSNAEGSILYMRIIGTTDPMPPTENLSAEQIGYILAWIKQGAQNN